MDRRAARIAGRDLGGSAFALSGEAAVSDLLTVPEAAREMRISRSAAYELLRRGAIPVVRIGPRSMRVRRQALDRFIEDREKPGAVASA
jgi:excisionase family DNA binding protein